MNIFYFPHANLFTFCAVCIVMGFSSCGEKTTGKASASVDLLKYGIPCSINPPSDVTITKLGFGKLVDLAVKNNNQYDIQIFMSEAFTNNIEKLKKMKKDEISLNPFFSKIIEEFENGFIYEKKPATDSLSYDFKIIKIVGKNEITFQCGNSKEFSEKEVKLMINSILEK